MKKDIDTYQLKNVSGEHINLPSKIWEKLGWKLNDEVELIPGDIFNDKGESWKILSIERVKDIKKYDNEY